MKKKIWERIPFRDSPAVRDGLFLGLLFLLLLGVAIHVHAFSLITSFTMRHDDWKLSEFLTVMMVMPFGLGLYAARRLHETDEELKRRITAENEASKMALHDPLTGLPNRRKSSDAIREALLQAANVPVSLLAIDLNRFKAVNDLYGHAAGDQLLLTVGKRLVASSGDDALVSRVGGDEFCVMLTGYSDGERLIARVEAMSAEFSHPFQLGPVTMMVGASIGIATTSDPTTGIDMLMTEADTAMYRCKASGRNGFAFFEAGMENAALRRARIEVDLRQAIAEGHILPHFQPLVDLKSGDLLGYEVLARWHLPSGEVRLPEEFIPIAEETGLITDLFFSIFRAAAFKAREWPAHIGFSVNLSPVQFSDEWLVERILRALTEAGIAPARVEIEITESALVADLPQARRVILSLKNQGIHIALDDFGTGYSSLRHLSELPFDKLKIDRSFIHDIDRNPASQTIVRAVSALAHNLGLQVTAEGIETESSEQNVMLIGCDIGQGYLYGQANAKAEHDNPTGPYAADADGIEADSEAGQTETLRAGKVA